MEQLMILTSWVVGPDAIESALSSANYTAEWLDVTEQPAQNIMPSPNQFVVRCRCDAATADLIQADQNGFVLSRQTI